MVMAPDFMTVCGETRGAHGAPFFPLTTVNSTHRRLRTWLSPLCKRRTYVPSPSTARLRLGKKVEFTRQCHPTCLHGCICPKMGHLQAVDPPSAIKGWEFGWVNEGALWSPEFWRRAGLMAGPSCGAAGSGHEWSRRQRINRLGPRRRTRTACDGVPVFLKSRRGRRQRAACAQGLEASGRAPAATEPWCSPPAASSRRTCA